MYSRHRVGDPCELPRSPFIGRLQTMTPIQRDSSTLARLSVPCKAQAGDESAQQQVPCRDETNGTDGKMPMAGTRNQ